LAGSAEHWMNQVRAIALNVGMGNVWIEKVKFRTTPETVRHADDLDDGPLREITQYLEDLRGDDELLAPLVEQLSDLARKLPDELSLSGDDDAVRLTDTEYLRQMLDQVEPLLMMRLRAGRANA
jgi:hypothetical protein